MARERNSEDSRQDLTVLQERIKELEARLSAATQARSDADELLPLFTRAPIMVHSIDRNARLLDVSNEWLEVLGYTRDEVIGHKVTRFLCDSSKSLAENTVIPRLIKEGVVRDVAYRFRKKDGELIDGILAAVAEYDREGEYQRCIAVISDVSKLKRSEEALRLAHSQVEQRVAERTRELEESVARLESEVTERRNVEEKLERQRRFLRQVIDVDPNFIFAKDREGRFTLVNQAVADAYGTSVEDLIGKTDADFNPSVEEVNQFRQIDLEVMESLEERVIPEEQITDSKGNVRWLQTVKRPLIGDDNAALQVLGSATDITARRQAEDGLRESEAALQRSQKDLQLLAGKLLKAQEDERRLVARELHDDVSQRLAALAIEAGKLEQMAGDGNEPLLEGLEALSHQVVGLSHDVHDLSRQLHPSILEDLGLEDALASECRSFEQRENIPIDLRTRGIPTPLPRELSLCLYRIAQEALRNIAKHAGAQTVRLRLEGNDGVLTLCIEDDGCGFDSAALSSHRSLGLASMAERARMVQAQLGVDSRPGHGTRVHVVIPFDPSSESRI